MADLINQPPHYRAHPSGVESIEIAELAGFILGNAVKYLFRYKHKGTPRQDLEKARYYLKRFNATHANRLYRARPYDPEEVAVIDKVLAHEDASTPLWFTLTGLEKALTGDHRYDTAIGLAITQIDAELEKYPAQERTPIIYEEQ